MISFSPTAGFGLNSSNPVNSNQPRLLLSFMAGKMILENKLLKPEPTARKGRVEIYHESVNATFYWKLRPQNTVIDQIKIISGETTLRKIGHTTSFVFQIKQRGTSYFYWIQEPNTTQASFDELFSRMQHICSASATTLRDISTFSCVYLLILIIIFLFFSYSY